MLAKKNKSNPIKINLLGDKQLDSTQIGKIINWGLTIGKSIVFLTFAIVIICFFYRFSLDKKVENLNDKITENLDTIQTFSEIEPRIRKAQTQVTIMNDITSGQEVIELILRKIENSISLDTRITIIDINLNDNTLKIKGETNNEMVFNQILNTIKAQKEFVHISVDELSSGGVLDPTVKFLINIKYDNF